MNSRAAASVSRVEDQRIRAEVGMPKLVIRLSTLHPIFASVGIVNLTCYATNSSNFMD